MTKHFWPAGPANRLTDVAGLLVGHASDERLRSGVTAILCEEPAVAAVHVQGGAPGTRETDLLRPDMTVQTVDAVVLSGGSAFGLEMLLLAIQRHVRVVQIPVNYLPRVGESSVTGDFRKTLDLGMRMIGMVGRARASRVPPLPVPRHGRGLVPRRVDAHTQVVDAL